MALQLFSRPLVMELVRQGLPIGTVLWKVYLIQKNRDNSIDRSTIRRFNLLLFVSRRIENLYCQIGHAASFLTFLRLYSPQRYNTYFPCFSASQPSKKGNGRSPISDEAVGCPIRNTKRGARVCAQSSTTVSSILKLPTFRLTIALQRFVLSIGTEHTHPERTPILYHKMS